VGIEWYNRGKIDGIKFSINTKRIYMITGTRKTGRVTAISILFMLVTLGSYAQFPRFKPPVVDYDTAFLNRSPAKWSIRLYTASKYQQFRLNSRTEKTTYVYQPTKYYGLGAGFTLYRLNLDLAVNAFSSNPGGNTTDKSKQLNFIGSLYSGPHLFEISVQHEEGFFGKPRGDGLPDSIDTEFRFRDDIRTFNFGVDYDYLFNSKKYSFGSFMGTEIQKKSAGGALVGLFFSNYNLRADSSIIPADYIPYFEEHTAITDANIFALGLTGGYAYTLVFPLHIYLTLSLAPGFSLSRSELKEDDVWYTGGAPVNFSLKLISRAAIGYGGMKFYTVASVMSDQSFMMIANKNNFNYDVQKLKFVVGYRL
jgi:hypothetical protein